MVKTIIEALEGMPPEQLEKLGIYVDGEIKKFSTMKTEDLFKDTDGLSQGILEFDDIMGAMGVVGLGDVIDASRMAENEDGLPPFFDTIIEQALSDAEKRRAEAKTEDEDEDEFNDVEDFLKQVMNMKLNVVHDGDGEWEDDECRASDVAEAPQSTPLGNISKTEDEKVIFLQLQVAGFAEDDITVEVKHNGDKYLVEVTGTVLEQEAETDKHYKYTQKQYELAPFCLQYDITEEMYNGKFDVDMTNGILTVTSTPVAPKNTTKKVF